MASEAEVGKLAHLIFYFDVSSPYSYLAFERMPEVLVGSSYSVTYHPVYLPEILKQSGSKPDTDVYTPNQGWIKRHSQWVADSQRLTFKWPARYPFESLPYLRLVKACAPALGGFPSRWVVETALRHLWQHGLDPAEPETFSSLRKALEPQILPEFQAMDDPSLATEIQAAMEASNLKAIERGILGAPAIQWGTQMFNGLDRMEALAEALRKEA